MNVSRDCILRCIRGHRYKSTNVDVVPTVFLTVIGSCPVNTIGVSEVSEPSSQHIIRSLFQTNVPINCTSTLLLYGGSQVCEAMARYLGTQSL